MIERVAKAIFLKEGRAKDVAWEDADRVLALMPARWGEKPPRVSDHFRDIARAAIEAMREPTEEMHTAGSKVVEEGQGNPADRPLPTLRNAYKAMIGAALESEQTAPAGIASKFWWSVVVDGGLRESGPT